MKRGQLPLLAFLLLCLSCASFGAKDYRKGDLDAWIPQLMKARGITGLSIAVIDGEKIVKAKGYGLGNVAPRRWMDESTLFQAASISKAVTALGALILVERGTLALDEDVNVRLSSWRVPASPLSGTEKVTLRRPALSS